MKFLPLALLASCTTIYVHPTKSDQAFYKDLTDCEAKAGQAVSSLPYPGLHYDRIVDQCLMGEGWARKP